MKKFLLLMAAGLACLTAGATKIYVCGTKITGTTSFTAGGGTVSYDNSTRVLTISSVTYTKGGSSNNGVSVDEVDGALTINFTGTNSMTISGADVMLCKSKKATTINITGTTTFSCSSSSHAALKLQDGDVTLTGSGKLNIIHTNNGHAIKGGAGTENLTFAIKECYVQSVQQDLYNLNKVTFSPSSYSSSSANPGYVSTTQVVLMAHGNSSYGHASNVSNWSNGSDVSVKEPAGISWSSLSSTSYATKDIKITDEKNDPQYTVVGDFLYSNDGNYAKLVAPTISYRASGPYTIAIPGYVSLNGTIKQVRVGTQAFRDMNTVSTVICRFGVDRIYQQGLALMSGLYTVDLPGSLTAIDSYALYGSGGGSLTVCWATLNPGKATIHSYAFSGSDVKPYLQLPTLDAITKANSISAITSYVFIDSSARPRNCFDDYANGLFYVSTSMASASTTGTLALVGCEDVTSFTVPARMSHSAASRTDYYNITSVAPRAFENNTAITSATLNNNMETIDERAFYNCTALTTVSTKAKVIGTQAFYNCTALTTMTLSEGVQSLSSQAFYNTSITSLNVPSTLTSFYSNAFDKCYKLAKFTVASGNSYYSTYSSYGALYDKAQTQLIKLPAANSNTTDVCFPSTLKTISDYAFSENRVATYVELPYGVLNVGSTSSTGGHVFENATALRAVKIPSSVTSINYANMFYGCTSLAKVIISTYASRSNVTTSTFYNVPSSMRVYVPATWDTAAESSSAAYYTDNLWKNYNVTYGAWDVVVNGLPYHILNWTEDGMTVAYLTRGTNIVSTSADYNLSASGSLNTPTTFTYRSKTYKVIAIAPYAFMGNTSITRVTLNQMMLNGGSQFRNCTSLSSFDAGTDAARRSAIPQNAFRNTSLTIAAPRYGCTEVGEMAFADNRYLSKVQIPSSCFHDGMAHVASNFVRNCPMLEEIRLNFSNPTFMNNSISWKTVYDVAPDNSTNGCFYNIPKTCQVYVPVDAEDTYYNYTSSNGYKIWQYFTKQMTAGSYDYNSSKGYVTFTGTTSDAYSSEMYTAKYVYVPGNTNTSMTMGVKNYGTYDFIITDLGAKCFYNAPLSEISINWDNVTMTEIPKQAFQGCNISNFPWNKKITRIGASAFRGVKFNGVLDLTECGGTSFRLEEQAFCDNDDVTEFILPATTIYLGANALSCQETDWYKEARDYYGLSDYNQKVRSYLNLETVTCHATTPPQCDNGNPWFSYHQSFQTLQVPTESVNAYKSATYWRKFGGIISIPSGLRGDTNGDGVVSGADVTTLYDYLLDGKAMGGNGDVNGDGVISGADVTVLYGILLEQ